jgi:hypothetical protein
MNWFRQNKFLGGFLIALGLALIFALWFLLHEKGVADDAQAQLETTISQLNRLRSSRPFPSEENLRRMRAQTDGYRDSLGELEAELKARTLPLKPLQPNEFQAQLRQSVNDVVAQAATNEVQLPGNFYLGFDAYATSLPNPTAAPLLGRELAAIKLLVAAVVDARVDALIGFTRAALPEEKPTPPPTPTNSRRRASRANEVPNVAVTADALEISYAASPAAARKALNQITKMKEQLFIIRTLNVKNQVDKGPKRGGSPAPTPVAARAANPTASAAAVNFIVGTEHISVAARIDIINLRQPAPEIR